MVNAFSIEVRDQDVLDLLNRLQTRLTDMTPVMADLAQAMASETERNFAAQAGPGGAWPKLSESTIAMRLKAGTWPGRILQVTGGLAASVYTQHGPLEARIGAAKVYAAMHQFGGVTSAKSRIPGKTIPARPFLPISPDGKLQNDANQTVLEILNAYLKV